jgi:hypothetical protein
MSLFSAGGLKMPSLSRPGLWLLAASVVFGPALGACTTSVGDMLPTSVGGLPADAPPRAAEAAEYPAIHDMPPPRVAPTLDDDQQKRLEKDLVVARDRQEGRDPKRIQAAQAERSRKAAAKKQAAEAAKQSAGAGPNP